MKFDNRDVKKKKGKKDSEKEKKKIKKDGRSQNLVEEEKQKKVELHSEGSTSVRKWHLHIPNHK